MVKFDWMVDISELVTAATILTTLAYKVGYLQRSLMALQGGMELLKADFDRHCEQDIGRFNEVNRNIVQVSTSRDH